MHCPSNHWNRGDDVCADCGADLNPPPDTPQFWRVTVDYQTPAGRPATWRGVVWATAETVDVLAQHAARQMGCSVAKVNGGDAEPLGVGLPDRPWSEREGE